MSFDVGHCPSQTAVLLVLAGSCLQRADATYRACPDCWRAPPTIATDDVPFPHPALSPIKAQDDWSGSIPGLAHAFVFWGFVAFGGYTLCEFLAGLGLLDITHTGAFRLTDAVSTLFAIAVLCGIAPLIIRRGILRPVGLGTYVSAVESILIGLFITTLMVTFLLTRGASTKRSTAGRTTGGSTFDRHPRLPGTHSCVEAPANPVLPPTTVFRSRRNWGNAEPRFFSRKSRLARTVKDLGRRACSTRSRASSVDAAR